MTYLYYQFIYNTFFWFRYEAKPYNFYIFPRPHGRQAPDRRFLCQVIPCVHSKLYCISEKRAASIYWVNFLVHRANDTWFQHHCYWFVYLTSNLEFSFSSIHISLVGIMKSAAISIQYHIIYINTNTRSYINN